MNFLAHIFLSGDNDKLKVGNFMADSIKGKGYENYHGDLRRGILLHRKIDTFTDSHPIVYQSAHRLFAQYRHYNGVIVDVFYDHFLAKNWEDYHSQDLAGYIQGFYRLLENNFEVLPDNVQHFYPYMKSQNWLYNYKDISGIEQILFQMNNRVQGDFGIHHAVRELKQYYVKYEREFRLFFPQIRDYVAREKTRL